MISHTHIGISDPDQTHALPLLRGGSDEDSPGLRPEYHAHDQRAHFHDRGGENLVLACHEPANA